VGLLSFSADIRILRPRRRPRDRNRSRQRTTKLRMELAERDGRTPIVAVTPTSRRHVVASFARHPKPGLVAKMVAETQLTQIQPLLVTRRPHRVIRARLRTVRADPP